MNELEIFNKKIIEVITIHDDENQLKFLKIYPAFKSKQKLIDMWLYIYTGIMNDITINTVNLNELQLKKTHTINFMVIALLNDLIEYKTSKIFEIIDLMKELGDDDKSIDLIKTSALKGRAYIYVKRSQSYNSIKRQSMELSNIKKDSEPKIIRTILDFSPKDFAFELTFQVAKIVKKISYHELIYISQNDNYVPNKENTLPSIKLIKNFHELSFIVPTIILIEEQDNTKRIKIIKHLLKICDELKYLNNYHSLFAILSGLNNIAIQKIPFLWKPKTHHVEHFNEMCQIISPYNNYGKYREIMRKEEGSNIIPYIAITISDIKHLLEYPLYDLDNNDFDSYMCDKLLEILEKFKNLQTDYNIKSNDQICEFLLSINICEDNNYLCEISQKNKNNLQQLTISSNEESKLEESNSPQLSPKQNRKLSNSTRDKESLRSPKLNESPRYSQPSESPRIDDSPRIDNSPRTDNSPRMDESRKNIKKSKSKTISRLFTEINKVKKTDNIAINNSVENIIEIKTDIESPINPKIEINNLEDENPIDQIIIPNTEIKLSDHSLSTDPDIEISRDKINRTLHINQKNTIRNKKKHDRKSILINPRSEDNNDAVSNKEDITLWTTLDITNWLKNIGFEMYCDIFLNEEINGSVLLELTNEYLKNDLHINKLGHRITILKAINSLK